MKFYVPDEEKYPGIDYTMFVSFGQVTSPSFMTSMSEADLERINTSYDILHFYIPFLSTTEDGPPKLRLELLSFTSSYDYVVNTNVIFDLQTADTLEFEVNEKSHLWFQFDGLELRMSGKTSEECKTTPPPQDVDELEASIGELGITQNKPNFSICDELTDPGRNDFCVTAQEFGDVIADLGSNVCLRWTPVLNAVERCEVFLQVDYISQKLQDLLGLDDCNLNPKVSEKIDGLFDHNIKFPCVTCD